MRKNYAFIIGLCALFVPVLAGAAQVQVTLGANSISPSSANANTGDTVVWNNSSSVAQSVIGNNGAFQSGSIAPGAQFSAIFNLPGTYTYYANAGGTATAGQVVVGAAGTTQTTTYTNPNANYVPTTTGNSQLSSLEAQLQSLMAQINSLQGVSGSSGTAGSVATTPASGTAGSCPQIGRVLSYGSTGSDVSSLQQFLATSVGYTGGATGYFGSLTQAAVGQYQAKSNIISYGTPATTGYGVVGPRTAAAIRLACSSGSAAGQGIVSGFLQVTPVSGSAPLATTITATVNTAQSCSGATYTLDFGDNTGLQSIPTAAGNCAQQNQSFQHTYQNGGTYTVTLSAGGHSSTATVTVSGTGGSTGGTGTTAQATGSMTAFVTQGPAPLATTFYISCGSGLAYDVVFGDGTDLGQNGVSQSSCDGGLQSVAHTYTTGGSYNAQLVVFVRNAQGTITSQPVATQGITVSTVSAGGTTSSGTYPPPTLTPNVGGNPLAVSLQYSFDSSGCKASIAWGDGATMPDPGCTTFSGQAQTFTQTHTYAQPGNYTISLTRATQTNSVGVSISN